MIVVSVVIVATIFLVIIRYNIVSSVLFIIAIGRMMVDIMVIVMTIVVRGNHPCCMACLGRYHGYNCFCRYRRGHWVRHCLYRRSRSGKDWICCIRWGCKCWHCIINFCFHQARASHYCICYIYRGFWKRHQRCCCCQASSGWNSGCCWIVHWRRQGHHRHCMVKGDTELKLFHSMLK